jgi:ribosomal-protein-alanine N-acetyltransferase
MLFAFRPVDEATVRAFWGWRYEMPYDVYNEDPDEIEEGVAYFLDLKINCYGVSDEGGDLVAYCTFGPDGQVPGGNYGAEALDIGLGVRPDLTGQGRGFTYVNAAVDFSKRRFAPGALRVTVAEFNLRAQRVWEKAGFCAVERFGREPDGMAFVVMMRDEEGSD